MGTVHMVGPADVRDKCVVCLMTAKQQQWEMYQDEIKATNEAGGDVVRWLAWPPGLDAQILDAMCMAVYSEAPHLGLVPLCWDHVAGVGQPKVQHVQVPVPPGLLRGKR